MIYFTNMQFNEYVYSTINVTVLLVTTAAYSVTQCDHCSLQYRSSMGFELALSPQCWFRSDATDVVSFTEKVWYFLWNDAIRCTFASILDLINFYTPDEDIQPRPMSNTPIYVLKIVANFIMINITL